MKWINDDSDEPELQKELEKLEKILKPGRDERIYINHVKNLLARLNKAKKQIRPVAAKFAMRGAGKTYPLKWEPYINKLRQGSVYLIPFITPEGVKVTKIGCGVDNRVKVVIKDARKVGLIVDGDIYVSNVSDHHHEVPEKYLHSIFRDKRFSQKKMFDFAGGLELFRVTPTEVMTVTEYPEPVQIPKIQHKTVNITWDFTKMGLIDSIGTIELDLANKPTYEMFNTGEIYLSLTKKVYTDPEYVYKIRVYWYTFQGHEPFELLGNPIKDSPEWFEARDTIKALEGQLSNFLDQWRLTNQGLNHLVALLGSDSTGGVLSLLDVAKVLSDPTYAIRVGVADWQHPVLYPIATGATS